MNRKCILYLLLICSSFQINCIFDSLPELMSYIGHTQEDPEIDNTDWEHPDFTSFYKSQLPTVGSHLKSFFGFKQQSFDVRAFQEMLHDVTEQRKKRGFHGSFIQKLEFINQGRLVVFGDLEGAFHSFVRSLSYISTLDILSQSLIFDQASYLVLNGNVINAAAYNLEILMLVLRLMQKNPEKVIYIRGKNEHNRDKDESGIYRQLKIIAGDEADILFNDIINFFDTLPSALYVRRGKPEILKIYSVPSELFKDTQLGSFLSQGNGSTLLHADELQKTSGPAKIEAIIASHDYSRTFGLKRYMGPPTTWQVFSSPTGGHKRLYGFFQDAFVIVDSAIHFHDWMITLYLRDPQTGKSFDSVASYNLATGVFISGTQIDFFDALEINKFESMIKEKQKVLAELKEVCKKGGKVQASEPKKTTPETLKREVLRVGASGDISKTGRNINVGLKDVLIALFKAKNEQGGVSGVTFQYVFLDDEANQQLARQNYSKFVNELGIEILLASIGTATIQEAFDFFKENKLMLFFPAITESGILRKANLKNIVSLSPSYYEQGKALVEYIFKENKPKKIVLVYENDDFGKDGLAGAKKALEKLKFDAIVEIPYDRNQVNFSAQSEIIGKENPDAIGFFGLPLPAFELAKSMGPMLTSKILFFGVSDLREEMLFRYLKDRKVTFIFASSLPDVEKSGLLIADDFKKFAREHTLPINPFTFEAYVIGQLFFYLIERVNGPITKEKLMRAAEQIKNIDFKGLKLNFDPEHRVLLDSLWIAQNNDEPWIKVTLKEEAQEKEPKSVQSQVEDKSLKKPQEEGVLTFGTSLDLSKTLKRGNESIKNTVTKLFESKNMSGGVRGLLLRNIYLDDAYTPSIARQNYEKLINEMKVDMIFGSRGTPTTKEMLDFTKEGQAILLFTVAESSIFRTHALKNVINLTPSFYDQGSALIETIFKNSTPKKIALFYQNDDFGRDLLNGAKNALKKRDFKNIIEIPYERGQSDFIKEADILKKENPDAIGLFSIIFAATELIKNIGAIELAGKTFFASSAVRLQEFSDFMQSKGLPFMYASSLPDWQANGLQIAQDYRAFAGQNNLVPDSFGFEAYIVANLLFYLIEHIEGPVTKENIIKAAEKVRDLDFKGLHLNFDPETRVLLDEIWIAQNNGQPWLKVPVGEKKPEQRKPEIEAIPQETIENPQAKQDGVLTFGTSLDLSKTLKKAHESIKNTITKLFDKKNKSGGIHGVLVRDIFFDDAYTPSIARQNYEKLLNDMHVDMIFASRGTPTTKEALDFVKDGRMALFFPVGTDTSIFRSATLKNAISLTASFYEQAHALIEMLFKSSKPSKIAFFYQNDDFGRDLLDGAKSALKKINFENIIEIPYERGQADFSKEAALLKKENPNAIGLFGIAFPANELIKAAGALALSGKIFFGSSTMREQDFLKFMQDKGLQFIYANSLPDWQTQDLEIAQDYRTFASQSDLEPDAYGFEAYVVGELLFYFIEQVEGPITKEKIIRVAENIHDYDFKGLKLNFDPATRTLLNEIWIGKNNNDPWTEVKLASRQQTQPEGLPEAKNIPTVKKGEEKEQTLEVGSSSDFSKAAKALNLKTKTVVSKLFEEKNNEGGIHNILFRYTFFDDEYTPEIARKNFLKLLNELNIDIIFAPGGTATTKECLDLVQAGKMILLFPIATNASIFRKPELKNVINLTASYFEQGKVIADYILEHYKSKKIGLFYQDDEFGRDGLKGLMQKFKEHNFSHYIEIPFERNKTSFVAQKQLIEKEKPEVLVFFSIPSSAIGLIRDIGTNVVASMKFIGISDLFNRELMQFLKDRGLTMTYINSVPDAASSDMELAREFRSFIEKEDLTNDATVFEAYIAVKVFFYLIKQIENPVTKEKIIQAAEQIKDLDLMGLRLNFDAETRTLIDSVWIVPESDTPWIKVPLERTASKKVVETVSPEKATPEKSVVKIDAEKVPEKVAEKVAEKAPEESENSTPKEPLNDAVSEKKETKAEKEEVKKVDEKPVMALHGNELLLGNTSDSTKGLKPMTDAIRQGMELAVKEINDRGGVNNIRLKIDYLSDEYTPDLARKNIETFLRDFKTELFIGSVGTAPLDGYIDLVKNGTIAVFFPFSGSSDFRIAALKNMIHFTPSYAETTGAATTYILDTYSPKKWALLYQNDVFGTVLKAAMRTLLEERKINDADILEVPYDRNDVNFTKQVKDIVEFNPDVIGFYGPAVSAQGFIRVADVGQLASKVLYGLSWLAGEKLQSFLKDKGLKMIIPSALPDPKTSDMPIAQKFRKVAQEAGIPLDVNAFEGYLDVLLFAHLLKQVEAPITIEKIMRVAQSYKNYDFEGLTLNFNPTTRVLSHQVWLDLGDGKEWFHVDLEADQTNIPEASKSKETLPQEKGKKGEEKPLIALHGDILLLGNTSDSTKGLQSMTTALRAGMDLGINEINEAGGINNIRLQLSYLDDGYIPEIARKNIETLIKEYNTNLFMACVGTPTLMSYMDLVQKGEVTVFFPFTGASEIRTAANKNLLFYSDSYDKISIVTTDYILKNYTQNRWVLLYQDDSFGIPPKDAVKKVLEAYGGKEILEVSFERNSLSFEEQVKKINAFNADVIGIFGPAIAAQGLISAAGVKTLASKIMYGLHWLGGNKLQAFLKEKGLKIIIPCVVPNPNDDVVPIVKKFKKIAQSKNVPLDVNALEGYINIMLFGHLLKQVEAPITVEKIMQAGQNLKDYDFEGLKLNFDPNTRVLSHDAWLDLGNGKEWVHLDLK